MKTSYDSIWLDNDSASISVTAYDVGSCNIIVKVIDGATYDEEEINAVYYIKVDVEGKTGPQEVRMPYANINSGEITENTVITLICGHTFSPYLNGDPSAFTQPPLKFLPVSFSSVTPSALTI